MMETDPDWAPSLHLGHTDIKPTDTDRSLRRGYREQLKKNALQATETGLHQADEILQRQDEVTHEATENPNQQQTDTQKAAENVGRPNTKDDTEGGRQEGQTECNLCVLRCAEMNRLLEENRELGRELDELRISDGFFGDSNEKVKYYTGLPNLATFMALFNFLLPLMSAQNKILSPFQMLLLTFMRLILDLPSKHLAYLFCVSPKTVYRTFNEMLSFLYANLKRAIVWPDRDTLHKIMPHQFVDAFGHRVTVIIDCFEIFTEKPANK
ncbi:uncharacterized protein LOC119794576 [Cyprinodon tularosa]|uniref:uncharacterized protein LOC119794576 n=1 Tax=Cyprinodon tularosa TaxID=77115 RepID=UPI0018E1DFE8|nr:uncharacterized protein LOC119794576 [Cyprinodon tularosa]